MESKDRAPNTAALHGSSGGLPESSRAAALGSCPKTLGGLGELRLPILGIKTFIGVVL